MKFSLKASLIAVGLLLAVYAGGVVLLGGNSQPAQATAPESADVATPQERLITDYHATVSDYYEDAEVSARVNESNGNQTIEVVVVEYQSDATSEDELMTQFRQVGHQYIHALKRSEIDQPPTLVMQDTNVQATLTGPAIEAYQAGDLKKNAVLETIEVTDVERPDTGSGDDGN